MSCFMRFVQLLKYFSHLTDHTRQADANRHLGWLLAFVAGALNAGGFLAVAQYTSHMTGIVSTIADQWILGNYQMVWLGLLSLLAFLVGSACTTAVIRLARLKQLNSEYALPLLLESLWLLCFGVLGAQLSAVSSYWMTVLTIVLLCFLMGTQNAVITKVSASEIRTTHVTGTITDLGILFGRYVSYRVFGEQNAIDERFFVKLYLLLGLLGSFFIGGVLGALGFKFVGYGFTVLLACLLSVVSIVPVLNDLKAWHKKAT